MTSYTMQLREFIEQASQNEVLPVREQIAKGKEKLFDFEYPIFDESYKNVFETNFIRNFYMREIGFETEGLFKFQLESWLLINMPYFNKLFETELLKFDPLANTEMSVTHNKTNDKKQNDTKDKVLNEDRNKTQNDNRDITQNDQTNVRKDGTVNSLTTQDSSQTSKINGTSNDETDVNAKEESTKLFNGADAIDNFNRDLESTTPDSRLAITTQDGKGVIEYASNIKELTEKNKKVYDNRTRTDGTNDTNSKSKTTNEQNSQSNADATNLEDTNTTNNENINLVSSLDDNLTSSSNDRLNGTANEQLISSINDIEDYVEHRVGKIGSMTYGKMIQEYRESFLRIEKQIFNEMNELFMLVY